MEAPAETQDAPETQTEQKAATGPACEEQPGIQKEDREEQGKLEEHKTHTDMIAVMEQVEEVEVADVADVGKPDVEADVELEEESEKEQTTERDVEDGVLLSEKERQNEEVNEKDNCSASSISSTSSTLEREEREEKLTKDIEAGTTDTHSIIYFNGLSLCFSPSCFCFLFQQASGRSALKTQM